MRGNTRPLALPNGDVIETYDGEPQVGILYDPAIENYHIVREMMGAVVGGATYVVDEASDIAPIVMQQADYWKQTLKHPTPQRTAVSLVPDVLAASLHELLVFRH